MPVQDDHANGREEQTRVTTISGVEAVLLRPENNGGNVYNAYRCAPNTALSSAGQWIFF